MRRVLAMVTMIGWSAAAAILVLHEARYIEGLLCMILSHLCMIKKID